MATEQWLMGRVKIWWLVESELEPWEVSWLMSLNTVEIESVRQLSHTITNVMTRINFRETSCSMVMSQSPSFQGSGHMRLELTWSLDSMKSNVTGKLTCNIVCSKCCVDHTLNEFSMSGGWSIHWQCLHNKIYEIFPHHNGDGGLQTGGTMICVAVWLSV